ncbi:MAG: site-2 protease family protein [Tepidiformaceae bacterium]
MVWYLDSLADNPQVFLVYLAALMVAIFTGLAFHEFCHAWTANELGDDTAARQGRLTLNPLAHLDPIGSVLLLLFGFGWAKPTPVNPWRLRNGPLRGNAIVAFAGPASNFVFAAIAAIPLRIGLVQTQFGSIESIIRNGSGEDYIWLFLFFIISLNIILGVFNLIPIPPLDGFKVVVGILPRDLAQGLEKLAPYGPGVLMTLLVIGFINPAISPLSWLINFVYDDIFSFLV